MSPRASLIILFLMVLIGLGAGLYLWVSEDNKNDNLGINQSVITSLVMVKPNLVVHGKNLSKVEIYATPSWGKEIVWDSSTEAAEANSIEIYAILLGEAKSSLGGNDDNIWTLPIPTKPIFTSEIYAIGYDGENNKIGRVSLNITGATDIYNALWSETKAILLQLKVGQTGTFENLSLKLNEVIEDSRCAIGVECIQAGDVTLEMRLISGRTEDMVLIHQNDNAYAFGDFLIDVIDILPIPVPETKINLDDYLVTFSITKNVKP